MIDDKEGQKLDEEDPGAIALLLRTLTRTLTLTLTLTLILEHLIIILNPNPVFFRTVGGATGHYKKITREEIIAEEEDDNDEVRGWKSVKQSLHQVSKTHHTGILNLESRILKMLSHR